MEDGNINVDVYCQLVEKAGSSLMFTLEVDDLPNIDEAEKIIRARLMTGGKKVTVWDVMGVMFYINSQNRIARGL